MKGLQVLFVCCLVTSTIGQRDDKDDKKNTGNTRFFGGGGHGGGGLLGDLAAGVSSIIGGTLHGGRPGLGGLGGLGGHLGGIGGHHGGGIHGGGIHGGGIHGGGIHGGRPPIGGGGFLPGGGIGGGFPGIGGGFPGVGGGFPVRPVSNTCRRWCRTPQGQAYCCESNAEPDTIPFVKPGVCPPVRPVCPPVRNFAPPITCSNDSKCGGVDKCCFDTCLQEHVCKPPVGSGGFGGFGR